MSRARNRRPAGPLALLLVVPALIGSVLMSWLLAGCTSGGQSGGGEAGFVSGDQSITVVSPQDRRPAPAVQGPRLGGDQPLSTDDYPGKVLVINVWGSWCNPCRAEAPDLQSASVATARTAQFIGLNTKDYSPAAAEAFVRRFEISYPSIFDPEGKALVSLAGNLPPNAIPTTIVIDAQRRVAARIAGTVGRETLVDLIDDVAAGR